MSLSMCNSFEILLTLRDALVTRANGIARAMLAVLNALDENSSICNVVFKIKPWLNLGDSEISESINLLLRKANSEWDPVSDGAAGELHQAVVAMHQLIGEKGSLLDQLGACSVERMMQLLSGPESEMSGLGMAFKELENKVADWNKAAVPNVTDMQNKLVEEASCLSRAAKVILACQSGALSVCCCGFGMAYVL